MTQSLLDISHIADRVVATALDTLAGSVAGAAYTVVDKGTQAVGGTLTLDLSTGSNFKAVFGAGNLTVANPTNVTAGQSGVLSLQQDGVGSRTVTWGGNWKFSGATAPTLTTTASALDLITFIAISPTVIVATLAVSDYR